MYANKSVADAPLQGKVDGARMASRGGCPLSAISLERLLAVTVRREIDALTLEELDCVLASDAHHHRTPSRNYGGWTRFPRLGFRWSDAAPDVTQF